ncbi:MAG: hypothetical protein E6K58_04940 [Nitrospirae bacterium]|nr:MAG: hypothetical protein E6K61_02395 [Nitrospirota bacterium]TLY43558.1 MAG: hypothetical protein E6K58_04940 [Nitrospirota bacterium]
MLVPGCGKGVTDAIDAQVRAGATTVDIGHLTDFNWDRLFVFGPYSFPEMICSDLGLSSSECSAAGFENVDEGHFLLTFMKGRTISYRETFSRFTGNFDKGCLEKAIPRAEAQLAIERRAGGSAYLVC